MLKISMEDRTYDDKCSDSCLRPEPAAWQLGRGDRCRLSDSVFDVRIFRSAVCGRCSRQLFTAVRALHRLVTSDGSGCATRHPGTDRHRDRRAPLSRALDLCRPVARHAADVFRGRTWPPCPGDGCVSWLPKSVAYDAFLRNAPRDLVHPDRAGDPTDHDRVSLRYRYLRLPRDADDHELHRVCDRSVPLDGSAGLRGPSVDAHLDGTPDLATYDAE